MPVSIAALLMLAAALWMVLHPEWWITSLQQVHEHMEAFEHALRGDPWPRPPLGPRVPRDDRRTRAVMRFTGALFALIAAMSLYEQAVRMLAG